MNTIRKNRATRMAQIERPHRAFTLVEILVVVAIIGLLITLLGSAVTTSIRKARETATTTLLMKIEGLLDDRRKGFERAIKSRDFERIVQLQKASLEAGGIFGVSPRVIESIARKDFFRQLFPQRYYDMTPRIASGPLAGVPAAIAGEDANGNGTLDAGEDLNSNGVLDKPDPALVPEDKNTNGALDIGEDTNGNGKLDGYIHFNHKPETESAAVLYFMLTQMQSFGVTPIGESDFRVNNEIQDTDGDGLLEFVDGWGRPLRFYRWPTRLMKPNGPYGADGVPGNGGSSFLAYGTLGTDDVAIAQVAPLVPALVPLNMRPIAGLLMEALPPAPAFPLGQWDPLSEDPEDPYGLISTEMKRLFAFGIVVTGSYNESFYPTLDTYHTPLVVSCGADGDLGLYEPYLSEADTNANGLLDGTEDINGNGTRDFGTLAQPIHGSGGAYDITTLVLTPNGNNVISALTDNLTNRNRRAGKGK